MTTQTKKTRKNIPIFASLSAGAIAGSMESIVTYPAEFAKTQMQLTSKYTNPVQCIQSNIKEKGVLSIYRGLSAQIIGTASKAAVRFFSFEQFKNLMKNERGELTSQRLMLAGLCAGITEALLVVTPTETIKTKLIHDQNRPIPQYKSLIHGVKTISKQEGLSGLYRGVTAVVARQGANSAVRLTIYGLLKEETQKRFGSTASLPWYINFLNGSIAGIITVYSTMPLDVVKTKMQSLDAKSLYKNSLDCLIKTTKNEGFFALWKGATPRLGRLIVKLSGGIVFTVYEQVLNVYESLGLFGAQKQTSFS